MNIATRRRSYTRFTCAQNGITNEQTHTSPTGTSRLALFLCALLAFQTQITLAQTPASEVDSHELMGKIVELGADSGFQRGNPEKQGMFKAYLQEIIDRAEAKQPSAMFYYGWYRYQHCGTFNKEGLDVSSALMCIKAFEDVKAVAQNEKIRVLFESTAAMSMLGEMYSEGIGTRQSKYLAADWFIKSARQQAANGNRDGAVRALEDALNVAPRHPGAIELQGELLR